MAFYRLKTNGCENIKHPEIINCFLVFAGKCRKNLKKYNPVSIGLFIGFALGDMSNFIVIAVISLLSYPAYILLVKRKEKVFQ